MSKVPNLKPAAIPAAIDALYEARANRLALQKEVDALKKVEELNTAIISASLRAAKLEDAAGEVARFELKRAYVPQVVDEEALLDWGKLKANRNSIKVGIVTDKWKLIVAGGDTVPGCEAFLKETVSLTKI